MEAMNWRALGKLILCKRLWICTGAVGLVSAVSAALVFFHVRAYLDLPVDRSFIDAHIKNAFVVRDRHGAVLCRFFPRYGGQYHPVRYQDIPQNLRDAVLAAEDKRFFFHPGVDVKAAARALWETLQKRRITSGASTITQQLVRLIQGRRKGIRPKVTESLDALRYERALSKEEILTAYLNRCFFGNQLYGIGAACEAYLGKPLRDLSVSESAFLTGMIKSGTVYNPYRSPEKTENRRRYVLRRMLADGRLAPEAYALAVKEGISLRPKSRAFTAPHFAFFIHHHLAQKGFPVMPLPTADPDRDPEKPAAPFDFVTRENRVIEARTTLDARVQKTVYRVLKNNAARLRGLHVSNGAVVVLNPANGEILAMVGSLDFLNKSDHGQVNGATALRQPGSTLKPFLYAYVFTKGHHPSDITADIQTDIPTVSGVYSPVNFDRKFHGPVSIRESLACSYNIPAVRWLFRYHIPEFIDVLRLSGLRSIKQPHTHYGLGIALGTAEVSLLELTAAYSVFAAGGLRRPIQAVRELIFADGTRSRPRTGKGVRVFEPDIVYLVNSILTDRHTRLTAFPQLRGVIYPFDLAYKTGTSKDYRDAWVVGYTNRYVVGVWLGDFKGASMNRVTGGNAAVPLVYDIFLELNPGLLEWFALPPHLKGRIITRQVCAVSGQRPGPHCPNTVTDIFIRGREPKNVCAVHRCYVRSLPDGRREEKTFAALPPKYAAWCRRNDWPLPDPEWQPLSPAGEKPEQEGHLRILTPDDRDIYRIDPVLPREYQSFELTCTAPARTALIEWRVNEKLFHQGQPGQPVRWILTPGTHVFTALAHLKNGVVKKSRPVSILVE